jgi:hypothetical protein
MKFSVLYGDDYRGLVRVPLRVYRDVAGYTWEVLGAGNRIAQLLLESQLQLERSLHVRCPTCHL